jgi:TonB family protein
MRYVMLLLLAASSQAQQIGVRISAEPPLSLEQVEQLEANIRADPSDKEARLRLLRHYSQPALRRPHVLYLIETFPADPAAAAQPVDDPAVRDAWMRAVDRFPNDADIQLNAFRALNRGYPGDAEQILTRALDRDPANRRLAVNLGFLHAMTVLGMNSADAERARLELERPRNAFVAAGGGVALPNLFPRTPHARNPNAAQPFFEFASRLMTRARELAPDDAELRGPMPLIREFQEFQGREMQPIPAEPPREVPPGAIRVAPEVQAAKLVDKPEAAYPLLARQARIQGRVRLSVLIGLDGGVENVTVLAGHPLLVQPAMDAVRRYRYQPTLLNGAAVQVVSEVEVLFTLK